MPESLWRFASFDMAALNVAGWYCCAAACGSSGFRKILDSWSNKESSSLTIRRMFQYFSTTYLLKTYVYFSPCTEMLSLNCPWLQVQRKAWGNILFLKLVLLPGSKKKTATQLWTVGSRKEGVDAEEVRKKAAKAKQKTPHYSCWHFILSTSPKQESNRMLS